MCNPVPMLIGLSGKKRMGKDTLAAQMITGHGFRRFAIADAIKTVALDVNPYMVNEMTGEHARLRDVYEACGGSFEGIKTHAEWDPPVREFLQNIGAVIAYRDPKFWPYPVIEEAAAHVRDTGNGAVITDIRFTWEVDMVRAAGGVVVRVFRSDRPDSEQTDGHSSEVALDDIHAWSPEALFDTTPLDDTFASRVTDLLAALQNGTARDTLDDRFPGAVDLRELDALHAVPWSDTPRESEQEPLET